MRYKVSIGDFTKFPELPVTYYKEHTVIGDTPIDALDKVRSNNRINEISWNEVSQTWGDFHNNIKYSFISNCGKFTGVVVEV